MNNQPLVILICQFYEALHFHMIASTSHIPEYWIQCWVLQYIIHLFFPPSKYWMRYRRNLCLFSYIIYPLLRGVASSGRLYPFRAHFTLNFYSFLLAFFFCFFFIFNSYCSHCKCLGKHLCMSSTFYIAILNGTFFFTLLGSTLFCLGIAIKLNNIIIILIMTII